MGERHFPGKRDKEKSSRVELCTFRFRGYPDEGTEKILLRNINGCRGFWNILCAAGSTMYREMGFRLNNTPADYKDASGYEWLADIDSLALANVQQAYERAMNSFFSGDTGYPCFKKKGRCRAVYTTNCSNAKSPNLILDSDMLKLPKVKTRIRLNIHRKIRSGGMLKRCTVSLEAGCWYFSLLFEYPKETYSSSLSYDPELLKHIGLDMSVLKLYVDSFGNDPGFLKPYRLAEKRLAKEQKKLSRMLKANTDHYEKKGKGWRPVYKKPLEECSNIRKQTAKVSRLYAKIKHTRLDALHKISAMLTNRYDVISIEDLNIQAMKRNLKPGKSVSDIGWGIFSGMLDYKQKRRGHVLIKVSRWFPSSRKCSVCGHIHRELTLSDRTYICPVCGNTMDRDYQAAVNIDREGIALFRASQEAASCA